MSGFIYCICNDVMPNILKLGTTKKSLIQLLDDANNENNVWNPPSNYYLKYAKEVNDYKTKFTNLEKLLRKYQASNMLKNNFYQVELDDILIFLDLMDGVDVDINNMIHKEQEEQQEEVEKQEEVELEEQEENEVIEVEENVEEKQKKKRKREKKE